MAGPGFQEAQAQFITAPSGSFVGQVRRFGDHGPAYEVVGLAPANQVSITVIESGECLTYPITALMADPMAETIP
jgi:Family of unknown function (DUF5397)